MVLGLLLTALGLSLLVAEAHITSAGVLGVGGVAAFATGVALMLGAAGAGLALTLVIGAAVAVVALRLLLSASVAAAAAQRRRVRTGSEALLGQVGVVRGATSDDGRLVFLEGALWRAELDPMAPRADPLQPGERVAVEAVSGLTLSVRRVEEWESS